MSGLSHLFGHCLVFDSQTLNVKQNTRSLDRSPLSDSRMPDDSRARRAGPSRSVTETPSSAPQAPVLKKSTRMVTKVLTAIRALGSDNGVPLGRIRNYLVENNMVKPEKAGIKILKATSDALKRGIVAFGTAADFNWLFRLANRGKKNPPEKDKRSRSRRSSRARRRRSRSRRRRSRSRRRRSRSRRRRRRSRRRRRRSGRRRRRSSRRRRRRRR